MLLSFIVSIAGRLVGGSCCWQVIVGGFRDCFGVGRGVSCGEWGVGDGFEGREGGVARAGGGDGMGREGDGGGVGGGGGEVGVGGGVGGGGGGVGVGAQEGGAEREAGVMICWFVDILVG